MRWRQCLDYALKCWIRRPKSSCLSVVTFVLVTTLLTIGLSWLQGLHGGLRNANRALLGDHKIVTKDHHRLQAFFPLTENIPLPPLSSALPAHCEPQIRFLSELRSEQKQMATVVYGLDEGQWSRLLQNKPSPDLVLGATLANDLSTTAGAPLTLLTETQDQVPSAAQLNVAAVQNFAIPQLNNVAFVSLQTAQNLTDMPERTTELLCFGTPAPLSILQAVSTAKDSDGKPATLLQIALSEQQPYAGTLRIAWVMNSIFGGFLLFIAGVVLLNLCLIQRLDKVREVAVLKVLGARTHDVMLMALMELQYSALSGALIGGSLGAMMSSWMGSKGIDLRALSQQIDGALTVQSVIYPEWQPWMLVLAVVASSVLAIVAALLPAYLSAQADPATVMQPRK